MSLSEFIADQSLGSWADDDIDLNSISVPVGKRSSYDHFGNSSHDSYYGSRHSQPQVSSQSGGPFIIKFSNLPETTTGSLIEDLFKSRFMHFEKCKTLVDPNPPASRFGVGHSNSKKKCAFIQVNTATEMNKVLKWTDIFLERSRVEIDVADFGDFNDVQQYNKSIGYDEAKEDARLAGLREAPPKTVREPHARPFNASAPAVPVQAAPVPSGTVQAGSVRAAPVKPSIHSVPVESPSVEATQSVVAPVEAAPETIPQQQASSPNPPKPKPNPFGAAKPIDVKVPPVVEELIHNPNAFHEELKPPAPTHPKPNPFGNAKPIDFVAKQLEVEDKLKHMSVNATTFRLGDDPEPVISKRAPRAPKPKAASKAAEKTGGTSKPHPPSPSKSAEERSSKNGHGSVSQSEPPKSVLKRPKEDLTKKESDVVPSNHSGDDATTRASALPFEPKPKFAKEPRPKPASEFKRERPPRTKRRNGRGENFEKAEFRGEKSEKGVKSEQKSEKVESRDSKSESNGSKPVSEPNVPDEVKDQTEIKSTPAKKSSSDEGTISAKESSNPRKPRARRDLFSKEAPENGEWSRDGAKHAPRPRRERRSTHLSEDGKNAGSETDKIREPGFKGPRRSDKPKSFSEKPKSSSAPTRPESARSGDQALSGGDGPKNEGSKGRPRGGKNRGGRRPKPDSNTAESAGTPPAQAVSPE
ncbi:unnamed protein product [Kuraishia capsulata CBS 1993]|uniref:RRM domain-containing protein n=1 Tax=Kuraishia capsulata CBS 1993 TaxID=1382522 RepID=W6MMW5_9ASCO|nr:uncharacterized protein KUCA_T00003521001 [Kuraishia capsulata CBS 1993]CDK27543.1 unnamed protein product [Kuraishia capsulata CBS 1993]